MLHMEHLNAVVISEPKNDISSPPILLFLYSRILATTGTMCEAMTCYVFDNLYSS